jgi:3-methyl-2-oxobutanoate hydroxymethyltransferase
MKITTQVIRKLKGNRPIVALTAYDNITARILDRSGVDIILIGDTVGISFLGFESTVPVTVDMILHHAKAVMRAKPNALVVADLPFPEAHRSMDHLLESCRRLMQEAEVEAVKLEGGENIAAKVAQLVEAGIPVLGHIGMLPQRKHQLGSYYKVGKSPKRRNQILVDAQSLEKAGAFAIVGENIETGLCKEISETVKIPLIGIGSGPHCDGQILVSTDLFGLTPGEIPPFIKPYINLADVTMKAVSKWADDVKQKKYP